MGIIESKILQYMEKQNRYDVMCSCNNRATYRCQLDENNKYFRVYYEILKPYWSSYCGNKWQYLGCDKCIRSDHIKYFSHHPDGWTANIKYYFDYEDIKL